jgi:hypothetical protein
MDIVVWLRSLGLEQYEAVFRKNEIDENVLSDLTEDHLRELGFPLGARLKILKAIAALGKHAEATSPSADTATSSTVSGLTSEDRAERRQVTVTDNKSPHPATAQPTLFGSATPCKRAAWLGVSPTMACS